MIYSYTKKIKTDIDELKIVTLSYNSISSKPFFFFVVLKVLFTINIYDHISGVNGYPVLNIYY